MQEELCVTLCAFMFQRTTSIQTWKKKYVKLWLPEIQMYSCNFFYYYCIFLFKLCRTNLSQENASCKSSLVDATVADMSLSCRVRPRFMPAVWNIRIRCSKHRHQMFKNVSKQVLWWLFQSLAPQTGASYSLLVTSMHSKLNMSQDVEFQAWALVPVCVDAHVV